MSARVQLPDAEINLGSGGNHITQSNSALVLQLATATNNGDVIALAGSTAVAVGSAAGNVSFLSQSHRIRF